MPKRQTLSLCMIARNEEIHLPHCLESVRNLVDDIVVVDTGSTDRTEEIARSFGARIFHLPWQDDFSAARNFSLEQAAADWILVLDADESIAARDHHSIQTLLTGAGYDAVSTYQRHYLASETVVAWQPGPGGYDEGKLYPGYVDVECRRLFRNRPWLRYRNPVHEELCSFDSAHPLAVIPGTWIVHHYGKVDDESRLREKAEAYLRIGLRKVEQQPRDPAAHYELGVQYREFNRPAEAIPCFERALALAPDFRDAILQIAISHAQLEQHEKALAALQAASRLLPKLGAEIALTKGNLHQKRGELDAAEHAFRRAIADRPEFAAASINLASLLSRQHRLKDALECLDRALTRCPGHSDLTRLRAQTRSNAGDNLGALSDLESLGARGETTCLRVRILTRLHRFVEARECLPEIEDTEDSEISALRGAIALGLGDIDAAIIELRRSMKANPNLEAALNLSTALEAHGEREGALHAAAQAFGVSPENPVASARFAQLAGDIFKQRGTAKANGKLVIFFYQPCEFGNHQSGIDLASALAQAGHRPVLFLDREQPRICEGVEFAKQESMPVRCLEDRPDVFIGYGSWQLPGNIRLAPLQIFWITDASNPFMFGKPSDSSASFEIDFVVLNGESQLEKFQSFLLLPAWKIIQIDSAVAASDWTGIAQKWGAFCHAALSFESSLIDRIANHLTAGRTGLGAKMLEREAPPEGLPAEVWEGLKSVAGWKAGSSSLPPVHILQRIAICIPAFRRIELLGS